MKIADSISACFFRRQWRGASRLHRVLLGGRRIEAASRHGIVWQLDPYEYVDGFVLRYGFYEEEVLEAELARLAPGEVFWDVGANIGIHALTVRRLRPDVRVHAFEPNPAMAALITAASARNALDLTLHSLALDADAGRAKFFVHEGNAGRSGLHNWDADPQLKSIEVATQRGDTAIAAGLAPAPHVLKIDVEGNEARTLQGMHTLLHTGPLHTVIFEDVIQDDSQVKTLLRDAGFTIAQLTRKEPTHHNLENYVAKKDRPRGSA